MNRLKLKIMLLKHEGKRNLPYTDTVGKLTIGVGRNLTDVGLSDDEITLMLDNDINRVFRELTSNVACFGSLDDTRQHVLMDMCFMGIEKLLKFTKMLAAIEQRDFDRAADEMLNSLWAKQVGDRATELAALMRAGS